MVKKIIKVDCLDEERLIKIINFLLFFAAICLFHGLINIEPRKPVYEDSFNCKDFEVLIPKYEWWKKEPVPEMGLTARAHTELLNAWMSVPVTYTTIDLDYCGRHYITAYCPEECGYNGNNYPAGWKTSSGEICHYSDDPLVPTTCAIDRNYHKYGEYLMIDGKIYVTEDTGPGVKGLWVDVFVETMEEVQSFGSHYTDVYNVTFRKHTTEGRLLHELYSGYLLNSRSDYRPFLGPCYRIDS